jgi:hypothetical protein
VWSAFEVLAMNRHIRLLPALNLLLVVGSASPVLAWDGFNHANAGFGARPSAVHRPLLASDHMIGRHHLQISNSQRAERDRHKQASVATTVWPFTPFVDTSAAQLVPIDNQPPAEPQVIIVSNAQQPQSDRPRSDMPPDFGYVPGCRAIPNGYHCDNPHTETSP